MYSLPGTALPVVGRFPLAPPPPSPPAMFPPAVFPNVLAGFRMPAVDVAGAGAPVPSDGVDAVDAVAPDDVPPPSGGPAAPDPGVSSPVAARPVVARAVKGAPVAGNPDAPRPVVAPHPEGAGPGPDRPPVAAGPPAVAEPSPHPDEIGPDAGPPEARHPIAVGGAVAGHPDMAASEIGGTPVPGDEDAARVLALDPDVAGAADGAPVAERPIAIWSPVASHPEEVGPVAGGHPVGRGPAAVVEMAPLPDEAGPGAEAQEARVGDALDDVGVLPEVAEVGGVGVDPALLEVEGGGIDPFRSGPAFFLRRRGGGDSEGEEDRERGEGKNEPVSRDDFPPGRIDEPHDGSPRYKRGGGILPASVRTPPCPYGTNI